MCLNPNFINSMYVPCGKCMECLISKSNEWAFRVMLEAQFYFENSFLTLTYDNEHLPKDGNVSKRDFQLFLKRLRKFVHPKKIRFFGCGEYGSKGQRPHYHIIIFGYDFIDKYPFSVDKKKNVLFRSESLEKLWPFGFSSIGVLNIDSAKYCAKYLQKDIAGKSKSFLLMSRRPGIGFASFNENWFDTDKIYVSGKFLKIPRYFLDKFSQKFPGKVFSLKEKRKRNYLKNFKFDLKCESDIIKSDSEYLIGCLSHSDYWREVYLRRNKFKKIFGNDFFVDKSY